MLLLRISGNDSIAGSAKENVGFLLLKEHPLWSRVKQITSTMINYPSVQVRVRETRVCVSEAFEISIELLFVSLVRLISTLYELYFSDLQNQKKKCFHTVIEE